MVSSSSGAKKNQGVEMDDELRALCGESFERAGAAVGGFRDEGDGDIESVMLGRFIAGLIGIRVEEEEACESSLPLEDGDTGTAWNAALFDRVDFDLTDRILALRGETRDLVYRAHVASLDGRKRERAKAILLFVAWCSSLDRWRRSLRRVTPRDLIEVHIGERYATFAAIDHAGSHWVRSVPSLEIGRYFDSGDRDLRLFAESSLFLRARLLLEQGEDSEALETLDHLLDHGRKEFEGAYLAERGAALVHLGIEREGQRALRAAEESLPRLRRLQRVELLTVLSPWWRYLGEAAHAARLVRAIAEETLPERARLAFEKRRARVSQAVEAGGRLTHALAWR